MRCLTVFSFLILSLMTFVCSRVQAQKAERIDLLKSELMRATSDTARVGIMINIAMTYQGFQMDSAMTYAERSQHLAAKINDIRGEADALLQIGRLERDQNKEVEGLHHMFQALELYRKIDDKVQIANSLNDISIIYANSGDTKNSLNYFQQALAIFRQMKDEKGESYALNNIGILYEQLELPDSARAYYLKSQYIKIKNKDLYGISRGYTNLGSLEENKGDWAAALNYYIQADSIYILTNDKQVQGQNYLAMARVKQKQGKSMEARKLALKAFNSSKEINELTIMLACSKFLAELDEKNGDYKSALAFQKIYNTLADSLGDQDYEATLEELKSKFNLEEKEREILILKKDKELHRAIANNRTILSYALTGGLILLLLVCVLIYYAYRTTKTTRDSLALKNKEIEQQKNDLDKLNKEKDRFFSILSHDLRSPLSALKGLSYLLVHHGEFLTLDESKEIKKKIDNSLDNLTELINNILEWSMTTSKKRKWTFDKLDATALIQKNLSLYQSIAESKDVRLVHTSTEKNIVGYADYQAIDTVVRNLLSNSIKFSHSNSEVIIKTTVDDHAVMISVKDYGVGIPPELQEKLFTMNSSAQMGTKNEKGTGIGLLLCKELMEENGGTITAKSIPDEGSEFTISFPINKA